MTIKPISSAHTVGTSFHDTTITATVQELIAAFGKPTHEDNTGDDKVNYEWCLQHNGEPFTIYDWKEYRRIHPAEPIEWHIGGRNGQVTAAAADAIMEVLQYDTVEHSPYVDLNYVDRTAEIEARFHPTLDDIKRDPELYAEVVNDLLYHWIYGTRETIMMNMFKQDILKPKA